MSIFKIFPGERRKTLIFAALAMLVNGGLTLGICASDSLFLSELGSEKLPYIYLMLPLVMFVITPISSFAQERLKIEKVIQWTILLMAIVSIGIGFLSDRWAGLSQLIPLLYFAKLFTAAFYVGVYTVFWNYVDAHFSILEAKRLYGVINAGSSFGIIVFGTGLYLFSDIISLAFVFYIWAIICILSFPLIAFINEHFPNLENGTLQFDDGLIVRENALISLIKTIAKSKFALFVGILYFLLPILNCTSEYLSFSVFSSVGDSHKLAALFGKLYGIANLLNLLISLFLFNGLVSRFGVRNLVLVQPILYFFVFVWYFGDLSVGSAVFGFFAYQAILPAIDNNNANLLFNALPSDSKKTIRTFIEGLGEPLAIAISGLLLLSLIKTEAFQLIAIVAVIVSVIVGVVAYIINQLYVAGIHENLSRNWVDIQKLREYAFQYFRSHWQSVFQKSSLTSANELDRFERIRLQFRMDPSSVREPEIRELFDLGRMQPLETGVLLGSILDEASQPLIQLFKQEIGRLDEALWSWAKEILLGYGLVSNKFYARNLVPNLDSYDVFLSRLNQIIIEQDRSQLPYLLQHLESDQTRKNALRGISMLVQNGYAPVAREVSNWLHISRPEELELILQIIRKTKHAESIRTLLRSNLCFSYSEKRGIIELILDLGARVVPILVDSIRDSKILFSNRSLALSALAKLSFPQIGLIWEELVEIEIEILSTHHRHAASIGNLVDEPGFENLGKAFVDLRNGTLEWILEIFAVLGKIPEFHLFVHSLNSLQSKERANSIELLIEGIGIRLYRKIEPYLSLYSGIQLKNEMLSFTEISPTEVIRNAITSRNELLVMAACECVFRNGRYHTIHDLFFIIKGMDAPEMPMQCLGEYLFGSNESTKGETVHRIEMIESILKHPIMKKMRSTALLPLLPLFEMETVCKGMKFSSQKWYFPLYQVHELNEQKNAWGSQDLAIFRDNETLQVSEADAKFVTLSAEKLRRMIRIYPQLGFSLLNFQSQFA